MSSCCIEQDDDNGVVNPNILAGIMADDIGRRLYFYRSLRHGGNHRADTNCRDDNGGRRRWRRILSALEEPGQPDYIVHHNGERL